MLYPLSYEGGACRKPGRKPNSTGVQPVVRLDLGLFEELECRLVGGENSCRA